MPVPIRTIALIGRSEAFYSFDLQGMHVSDSYPEALSLFTVVNPAHLY